MGKIGTEARRVTIVAHRADLINFEKQGVEVTNDGGFAWVFENARTAYGCHADMLSDRFSPASGILRER